MSSGSRPLSKIYPAIHAGMALAEVDSGRVLDANEAFCRLLGRERDQVVGQSCTELGLWRPGMREELVAQVLAEGSFRNFELDLVGGGGQLVTTLLSCDLVEVGGRACMLATALDVTEWRRTEAAYRRIEARLQAVGAAIPAIMLLCDRDGIYREVIAGAGMEALLVAPAPMLRGRPLAESMTAGDAEVFLASIRRVIDSGRPELFEHELPVQAGRRWFGGRIARIQGDEDGTPLALALLQDITERKTAEKQLHQLAEQRRAFARQLITVQEQERQRLARELHDDLGQILTALKLECKTIADRADAADRVRAGIASLVEHLNVAMTSVRNLVRGLHPNVLTDIGLGAALESMCRRITESTPLACGVQVDASANALPTESATAIFRIAQEALTNVVRHSDAGRVWLRLTVAEGMATLLVEDDGRGIDPASLPENSSLGLTSMRERASLLGGRLSLEPSPRGGLRVLATIPTT